MRAKKEIDEKIKEIKAERKTLPHYSVFGDNNWDSMDLQVEILEEGYDGIEDLQDQLDDILDRYDGDLPEEDGEDKWRVSVLDYLLENTDELC